MRNNKIINKSSIAIGVKNIESSFEASFKEASLERNLEGNIRADFSKVIKGNFKSEALRGFTLIEIMIVLVVLGIIASVLVPVVTDLTPDEKAVKFAKGHATLHRVIAALVQSDKYYTYGDLSKKPNGDIIYGGFNYSGGTVTTDEADLTYFCHTFADVVTTKSVNCSTYQTGGNDGYTFHAIPANGPDYTWQRTLANGAILFDEKCASTTVTNNVGAEIVTADNITYYQTNPAATFGVQWASKRLFATNDSSGFPDTYKIMCMDIDGINTGEDPFGYGIRLDGRILSGNRASEWLESKKDFQ